MHRIALLPHTGKPRAIELARSLVPKLRELGVVFCADPGVAETIGLTAHRLRPLAAAEAAIVLGGDGALLRAARLLYGSDIPILGVNLGHMGFLAEIEPEELETGVRRLLAGDYTVDERMMLEARVIRNGDCVSLHRALNDIVIARGTYARMLSLQASVDGATLGTFVGDGIIVATPTGSTAYSLSAGGPIVHPAVDAMIVTPICPHALGARPIVGRGDDVIRIRASARDVGDELLLTADGHPGAKLGPGEDILVSRAPSRTRLIRFGQHTFYDLLGVHLRNT